MATTPEGKVKAKVKAILKNYGAYHFSPATGGYGKSGVPDIIACYCGKFIGIECKAGDNKPTALQLNNIDEIRKNKGYALVVNETNIQDLEVILSELKAGHAVLA